MLNGTDFISKYTQYTDSVTDAPMDYNIFMAIATVGSVLGRSRYMQFGEFQIYPNFWLIILGPTTFYRKSTSLMLSQRILSAVKPDSIYPIEYSQEKLQEIIQDNPQGTFYYYEFKTLLGLLSRDYMAGCKAFLTELFDNPPEYTRSTKSSSICIENPCISLLSATTSDWFTESIKTGDIEGGFLNRFCYVFSNRKVRDDAIPKKADVHKRQVVYQMLSEIYEYNKNLCVEMELTPEARRLYEAFYHHFVREFEEINTQYRNLFAKINIYCLKIAIVLQTCKDGSQSLISDTIIAEAIQMTHFLITSLKTLCEGELTFNYYDKQERAVMHVLKEHNEITRTELLRYSHLDSKSFNNILQTLLDKNMITVNKQIIGNSRKSTMFIKLK